MDVGAKRAAVATAAASVTPPASTTRKLLGYGRVPSQGDPPFCYPSETDGNYKEATNGVAGLVVTLRILTSRSEDEAGQELLDAFLSDAGASSVTAAIEAAMPEASVTGFSGYRAYDLAAGTFYGAELTVVVLA